MYAIVDVAGQQFKVEKEQKIYIHRLEGAEGDVVEFDRVLLIEDGDKILIGEPTIDGALVSGKIISHLKGEKVKVFKKKRRKGYQVLKGHRQYLSQILIENIVDKGGKKKETTKKDSPKPEPKAKAEPKVADKAIQEKKAPVKKEIEKAKSPAKTTAKKQSAAKKTTAKSTPKAEEKAKTAVKKPTAKAGDTTKKSTAKKATPKKSEPKNKTK